MEISLRKSNGYSYIKFKPGHLTSLQLEVSSWSPKQFPGSTKDCPGAKQSLALVLVPLPHDFEHAVQEPHTPHSCVGQGAEIGNPNRFSEQKSSQIETNHLYSPALWAN